MDAGDVGRIKVCCRIRPLGSTEATDAHREAGSRGSNPVEIVDRRVHLNSELAAVVGPAGSNSYTAGRLSSGVTGGRKRNRWGFTFDDVLEDGCEQDEVYRRCAKNVVDSVLVGFNGTIMACEFLFY